MKIVWQPWHKLINEKFIPLIKNRSRYLICIGGRGSSKSDCTAKKLIRRCLEEPYFRYILYRRTYNTIKDSQYQNIKDIIYEWKLESLFAFTENPLQIKCINGNKFICRGGDDPTRLKSVKDPTGVWYEEEIPEEGDFITITTSIRTTRAVYLQEIFTVNPEVQGDYHEHWFYKRFFAGHGEGASYDDITTIRLEDGRDVALTYTVHHSTYKDNKWIPDIFIAQLLDLKRTNPYYYQIYVLGLWGNKTTSGNFYKLFTRARNVDKTVYDPALPLWLTFDFNVHPYVTLNVHQFKRGGKRAEQIDEICLRSPRNRTASACQEFKQRYASHNAGLFIVGDPAGLHEDTRTEAGFNDFLVIQKELITFRPQMRYAKVAPPVVLRGQFVNEVFDKGFAGVEFVIGENCFNTIADYENVKEASDGTKAKIRVKDKETGVSYEEYGHTSDANDYLYCQVFKSEFVQFEKGGNAMASPIIKTGNHTSKNSY